MNIKEYKCLSCSKKLDMTKAENVIGHLNGFVTKRVICSCGKTNNISVAKDIKKTVLNGLI